MTELANQKAQQLVKSELAGIMAQMGNLEKQVNHYRERVSYQESVEEEHKRNVEQQVDVILKMEEERLILIKEHKESKDAFE